MAQTLENIRVGTSVSRNISRQGIISVEKKGKVGKFLLGCSQWITWPFLFVYFNIRYDLSIRGKSNFSVLKSPFLIIANHINTSDSFLFRLILGLWTPHLPLRFMAVRKFNSKWLNWLAEIGFIDFIYSLFGVFTVVPGRGLQKNLEEARNLIYSGNNLVIYPEGTMNTSGTLIPFKPGAGVLVHQMKCAVIPVGFVIDKGPIRPRLTIIVGEAIRDVQNETPDGLTRRFYSALQSLISSVKA